MSNLKYFIPAFVLLFLATVVLAAPTAVYQRTILPEVDSTYSLGASGNEWLAAFLDKLTIATSTSGCAQLSSTGVVYSTGSACGTGAGTVTQINTTWPVIGGPITTTGTLTFGGLSTSSAAVIGNIPYFSGVNTFANVATTTASCSGNASCSPFTIIGASPATISVTGVDTFAWPFTAQSYGNSTSSVIGFLGGLFSTASSTFSSTLNLTTITDKALATNVNGLVYGTATGTVSAGTGISLDNATRQVFGGSLAITNSGVITVGNGTGTTCTGTNPASCSLAAIAANTVLANATGASAIPVAVATSTGLGILHSVLGNLAWTASGHTGTANTIPYFSNSGAAIETATSSLNLGVAGGGTGAKTLTGCLTGNGTGAITGSGTCNTSAATVTSIGTTWPIIGGTITTSGTLTFGGLSTSTAAVIGNIPVFSGVNTFYNIATSTPTVTSPLTYSGTLGSFVGGSGGAFACATCLTANQTITLSGDISGSGATSITTTIGSNKVTLGMLATLAANSVIGNITGGTATPTAVATSSLFTGTVGQTDYFSGTGTLVGTSTIFISTASNVGIGTTSPNDKLVVEKNINGDVFVAIGNYTNGTAANAGFRGFNNIGSRFLFTQTASGYSPAGAILADSGLMYEDGAGGISIMSNNASGIISFSPGGISEKARFAANGNFGVATTSPWRTLAVTGTVGFDGLTGSAGLQVGILCLSANKEVINESVACVASAERYKQNIKNLNVGLDELMRLRPVQFAWKPSYNGALQSNPNFNGLQYSLIADEVQKIDPRLVTVTTATTTFEGKTYAPGTVDGLASANAWTGLLVKSIQELNAKVDTQQKQIDSLTARIEALEKK